MTYSIVALDKETGDCGSAVASRSTAVGGTVTFSRIGVGVINTQHHAHIAIGKLVLDRLEDGDPPHEALERVLQEDEDAERRQFLAMDSKGRGGAWTGRQCAAEYCHQFGDGCVAAGNWLMSREVVRRMIETFEGAADECLELRLLGALRAGERAGGDRRGQRAAAIIVVPGTNANIDINLDIRVDHHVRPLDELERLLGVFRQEFPRPA